METYDERKAVEVKHTSNEYTTLLPGAVEQIVSRTNFNFGSIVIRTTGLGEDTNEKMENAAKQVENLLKTQSRALKRADRPYSRISLISNKDGDRTKKYKWKVDRKTGGISIG